MFQVAIQTALQVRHFALIDTLFETKQTILHLNGWPLQRLAPCRQKARPQLTCKAFAEHIARGRRKSCRKDQGASPVQVYSLHAHMHDCIIHNDNWLYRCARCRDSGVILLASGGAGMELLQIWGHWVQDESWSHLHMQIALNAQHSTAFLATRISVQILIIGHSS